MIEVSEDGRHSLQKEYVGKEQGARRTVRIVTDLKEGVRQIHVQQYIPPFGYPAQAVEYILPTIKLPIITPPSSDPQLKARPGERLVGTLYWNDTHEDPPSIFHGVLYRNRAGHRRIVAIITYLDGRGRRLVTDESDPPHETVTHTDVALGPADEQTTASKPKPKKKRQRRNNI